MHRPALLSLALLAAVGCQTYVRPVYGPKTGEPVLQEDPNEPSAFEKRERELIEATEDRPEDARTWFALADFYERAQVLPRAAEAYERMSAVIASQHPGKKFTAGDYHLGRVYALMGNYSSAVEHLKRVLALQPEDPVEAALYKHFRESHFLLGAIYQDNRQWDAAEEHFLAYRDLGGDPVQAERHLMDVRYARKHGPVNR